MNAIPPNGYRIEQAVSAWQSARARLFAEDADMANDEAALSAILGPETDDVRDILARLLRGAVHANAMADAADGMMTSLAARRDRFKRRASDMKATAFAIMDVLGEKRIDLPDMTVTIRAGTPSVRITDEAVLAPEYVRVTTTRAPDKAAILADLKQGVVIDGAEMSNGIPSIQIRSK